MKTRASLPAAGDARRLAALRPGRAASAAPGRGVPGLSVGDDALDDFPAEEDVRSGRWKPPGDKASRRRHWTVLVVAAVALATAVLGTRLWLRPRPLPPPKAAAVTVPARGTLAVETTPPGASVIVNDTASGVTPLVLSLAPGTYSVRVEKGGASRVLSAKVTAGGESVHHLELTSVPAAGQLVVRSTPSGAAVSLDGVPRGSTPLDLRDVPAGPHTVTVADGADTVTERVSVTAGGASSVVVPLNQPVNRTPGWLSVISPIELQVYDDRSLIGTSGSGRILVLAGRHTLRLVNTDVGFEVTRTVDVSTGRVAALQVDVPNGVLFVNAVPWAEVLLDGRAIGETPIANFSAPIGTHEITLRNPKFGEQRRLVVVSLTGPARLGVDLRQ